MPEDIGAIKAAWEFTEYPENESRSWKWYAIVGTGFVGCMIYAVMTMNWIFALILVLGAMIMKAQAMRDARRIPVKVGEDGIILDRRFYPYKDLSSFGIVYDPPVMKFLYIDFKGSMSQSVPIPLSDANPLELRNVLLNYLNENLERQEEDFEEIMAKLLKIL